MKVGPLSQKAIRVSDFNHIDQGEICYWKESDGNWYLYFPHYGCVGNLANHHVTENTDGTITASPSIKVESWKGTLHGYLENGIWRDA